MNPRQNALLELKMAGIRGLEFDDYFHIFGTGRHPDFELLYRQRMREHLGEYAQQCWDIKSGWFSESFSIGGLYFRGPVRICRQNVSLVPVGRARSPIRNHGNTRVCESG